MKRIITLIITACMLLTLIPMASHAETSQTRNLLTDSSVTWKLVDRDNKGGTYSLENGVFTAPNKNSNDVAYLTNVKIEKGQHVYIEATATIDEGMAWGILFTETPDGNPFDKWFCLNIDTDQMNSRMFFAGSAAAHGTPYGEPSIGFPNARDGKAHTLGVEILESGAMNMYLDGGLYCDLPNAKFEGATLGFSTCKSSTTFSSFTVKEGAPENVTAYGVPRELEFESTTNLIDSNVLKHSTHADFYKIEGGKLVTNGFGGGDRAIMSDIKVEKGDHVYIEATGKVIGDRGAFGLMFTTKSPTEPFANWFCMNVDGYRSRIFSPSSGYDVAEPREFYYLDDTLGRNVDVTIGMEITPDGTFYLTCNGTTYCEKKSENWNGAYIGLMTWDAEAEFSNATYSVVKGLKPATPENWETSINGKLDIIAMDGVTVLATVDYDNTTGTLTSGNESYKVRGTLAEDNIVILDKDNNQVGTVTQGRFGINVSLGKLQGMLVPHTEPAPEPVLTVGDNSFDVPASGMTVTFTAPKAGKYTIAWGEGEKNGEAVIETASGSDTIALPVTVELDAGESYSFILYTLDWQADTIDVSVSAVEDIPVTGDATLFIVLASILSLGVAVVALKRRQSVR